MSEEYIELLQGEIDRLKAETAKDRERVRELEEECAALEGSAVVDMAEGIYTYMVQDAICCNSRKLTVSNFNKYGHIAFQAARSFQRQRNLYYARRDKSRRLCSDNQQQESE